MESIARVVSECRLKIREHPVGAFAQDRGEVSLLRSVAGGLDHQPVGPPPDVDLLSYPAGDAVGGTRVMPHDVGVIDAGEQTELPALEVQREESLNEQKTLASLNSDFRIHPGVVGLCN